MRERERERHKSINRELSHSMASGTEPHRHSRRHHHHRHPITNVSRFIQSTASNLSSLIPFHTPKSPTSKTTPSPISYSTAPSCSPLKICVPLLFTDSPPELLSLPSSSSSSSPSPSSFESTQSDSVSSGPSSSPSSSALKGLSSNSSSGLRISSLNLAGKGGPAFVGQVFSMCDLSGTGLMAVSTHFDIPFISKRMLSLRYSPAIFTRRLESVEFSRKISSVVVCAAKGPRPRYPRVWKTRKRIGTISKSVKLVECVKELSNVKEEVYGALDSFIAWELEFPLITVKKALKTLENEKDWKRIIQVTKWMLSKGQGRTMGSYYTLLNALAEDGRLDEAEELWMKLFSENMESTPRIFFEKIISIYYSKGLHDKLFEVFADMEELGIQPTTAIVSMVGDVFQKLGMLDKYKKLKKKYPPPKWEYQYIKGKRVRIRVKHIDKSGDASNSINKFDGGTDKKSNGLYEEDKVVSDEFQGEANIS